jgi:hypothetical protein
MKTQFDGTTSYIKSYVYYVITDLAKFVITPSKFVLYGVKRDGRIVDVSVDRCTHNMHAYALSDDDMHQFITTDTINTYYDRWYRRNNNPYLKIGVNASQLNNNSVVPFHFMVRHAIKVPDFGKKQLGFAELRIDFSNSVANQLFETLKTIFVK